MGVSTLIVYITDNIREFLKYYTKSDIHSFLSHNSHLIIQTLLCYVSQFTIDMDIK